MSVALAAAKVRIKGDPAKAIKEAVGSLEGVEVLGPRVFVAVYERGKHAVDETGHVRTAGNIIIPETQGGTLSEDTFQGKVCLVLKKGSLAFGDGYAPANEHPDTVEIGDWIVIRPTDGFAMIRSGTTCRLVKDADILMKVPSPDSVF